MERIPIANRPKGLALSENQVWLAVQSSGDGHRGGRLVVGGTWFYRRLDRSELHVLGRTRSALSAAYDGLVGPARRGGSEGGRVVPNLATSLPVITAGGTRYAFQLRRGVRYSDGTLVKASDFRRAFERAFRSGSPRRGFRSSEPRPARAGRGAAISAGVSGRTTRPGRSSSSSGGRSSEFLRILLPAGSDPARHAGPGPGDASGPVDRAVHDRELRAEAGAHARPQSLLPRAGAGRPPGRVPRRDRVQAGRPRQRRHHGRRARAGRRRRASRSSTPRR